MPLKDFDFFPKVFEDHSRKTDFSGTVTVVCLAIMSYLLVFQTLGFIASPPKQKLVVDQAKLPVNEDNVLDWPFVPKLQIYIDIEFPSLPCPVIDFQVLDRFEEIQSDSFSKVKLKRIGPDGKIIKNKKTEKPEVCGSCYGAASGCCNTCKDVKNAFKKKGRVPPSLSTIRQCRDAVIDYNHIRNESCHVYGTVIVPPTHGTIVMNSGDSYGAQMNTTTSSLGISIDDFNFTHKINDIYIGENDLGDHPLKGIKKVQKEVGRYKGLYFIRTLREQKGSLQVYRATSSHYDRYREGTTGKFPGLYFNYDVSPIIVMYKRDTTVLNFVIELMAILGGIYSLGSLLDHLSLITIKRQAASIE
ncbi:hypothetical protein TVAG_342940 [Trichomonas vaginalis G3]|uniref:Endoplasmic reticulum-Golgi intermediate compartment protein 3 n=1 Tax=Trichomonas vaginalis (strain ATCC PRA-98 / G3) TaxID=412133 RepID=A2EJQ6_TRIV3|nr:vesicle-mediated transport [Trichomonas vaginalis G3]EAY07130.1 hypothetical protein TVAG_342940 [Trichomonas vaginalis G3]KAI5522485.1 vesicle-mediated transport [Trichomonas vaginalis G3]|eukprot:XP_001319353.1 hypothetical protein [Trichomonas vaginalis G3]